MLIGQLLVILIISLFLIVFYLRLKTNNLEIKDKYLKILSITLAVVFFFRYMLGVDAVSQVFALKNSVVGGKFLTATSILLIWFQYSAILLVVLYPFFKGFKYAVLIKYFAFVVTILNILFIYPTTIGIVGEYAYLTFNLRTILYAIELMLMFSCCFIVFMEKCKFVVVKKDFVVFIYIIFMLLSTIPTYLFSALFGNINYGIQIKNLTLPHRMILYICLIIPFVLLLLLRKKSNKEIRACLLYISLGTLISFSINFKLYDFLDITNWPFHLCNTAMYIIPICLIFKLNKLFYFTYFINVIGALLAMLMPNYSSELNLFSGGVVLFYINHFIAFFMPILMVALRVYPRPKLREFRYSLIGFGGYFLLVLILNAWFSNYGSVDYFFVNSDFIANKLGKWAENLRNFEWTFYIGELKFNFYPIYQSIFFFVYVFISLGVWFVYVQLYNFVDIIYDILERKKKINEDLLVLELQKERSSNVQMKESSKNKIILTNFSKKYANSEVYAVKDANLTINSGEVFGFLGHNGAGKSTIIKSIVGINPITSGKIEVCGYDVDKEPVMAKKNIGFVPDHYALYEKLTGREYINYIADLYDVSLEDRNKLIDKYVSLFELQDAFDNMIKTYSHGMKQKITIISALVHNPKVWILDEPLTGLDPISIYQVKKCLRQHAREGNIVFFSSHLIDIVEQVCDRVAIIKSGTILTCKKVKDIKKTTTLEDFYLETTKNKLNNQIEKISYLKESKRLTKEQKI